MNEHEKYLADRLDFIRRNSVYGICAADEAKLKEEVKELFKKPYILPVIHTNCKACGAQITLWGRHDITRYGHCSTINRGADGMNDYLKEITEILNKIDDNKLEKAVIATELGNVDLGPIGYHYNNDAINLDDDLEIEDDIFTHLCLIIGRRLLKLIIYAEMLKNNDAKDQITLFNELLKYSYSLRKMAEYVNNTDHMAIKTRAIHRFTMVGYISYPTTHLTKGLNKSKTTLFSSYVIKVLTAIRELVSIYTKICNLDSKKADVTEKIEKSEHKTHENITIMSFEDHTPEWVDVFLNTKKISVPKHYPVTNNTEKVEFVRVPDTGIGDLSDGYHTFNSLYYQRLVLFATLVNTYPKKSWKSYKHEDGELCFGGGWFIVGIDTPKGSYTYHYENKYFDMFECEELEVAKHWDGHTDKDVDRLLSLTEYLKTKYSDEVQEDPEVKLRHENELNTLIVELSSVKDEYIKVGDILDRFLEVEKEFPNVPWDLRQILNNISILYTHKVYSKNDIFDAIKSM